LPLFPGFPGPAMTDFSPLLLLLLAGAPVPCEGSPPEGAACSEAASSQQAYAPQPGDLLLFRTRSLLINVAYFAACSGGATHCGLVVRRPDGSLGMLEAPGTRYPAMLSDIPSRLDFYDGRVWVRRRRIPLTQAESDCLTAFACAQLGKPFNTLGIVAPIVGRPVRKPGGPCTGPEELDQSRWFCSDMLVSALVSAGLLDPCVARPKFTDPEDLDDDRLLDLSCGWEDKVPWHRCGPRGDAWWSEDCAGRRCWWR
jgi:hypothetical protein